MILIYHQQKKITLLQDIDLLTEDLSSCAIYQIDDLETFDLFDVLLVDESVNLVFLYKNENELLATIKKQFEVIKAGGGVVFNSKNELLLIERLEKWDLPKGKVEKNEHIEEAALREVEEETGIAQLQLIDFCCNTYHTYLHNNMWVLKETAWYFMKTKQDNQTLIPQTIEGITKVKWVKKTELNEYIKNTYENIKHVLNQAILQN